VHLIVAIPFFQKIGYNMGVDHHEDWLRPGLAFVLPDCGPLLVEWKEVTRGWKREIQEEAKLQRKSKRLKKMAASRRRLRKKALRMKLTMNNESEIGDVSISPVRKVEPEEMIERLAKKIHKEQS
jgi:hypothetical protein